jgi:hypothetical protein
MALIDSVEAKPAGVILAVVLGVAILVSLIYIATSASPKAEYVLPDAVKAAADNLAGSFWACNGLVCQRYMTREEWMTKYCYVQDGRSICAVRTQQGLIGYPLEMVNVTASAAKECAVYQCQQEVLVRNASYTIPVV